MGVPSTRALLFPVVLSLSGCSWIFMTQAREPVPVPNYPVDCTSSNAAPILDTICSGYFVANAIVIGTLSTCYSNGYYSTCLTDTEKAVGIISSAALATVCAFSAYSGYTSANRCQQVKDLNAMCITGDLRACQVLNPAWLRMTPAAPPPGLPYPPPPPQPPPPSPEVQPSDSPRSRIDLFPDPATTLLSEPPLSRR